MSADSITDLSGDLLWTVMSHSCLFCKLFLKLKLEGIAAFIVHFFVLFLKQQLKKQQRTSAFHQIYLAF